MRDQFDAIYNNVVNGNLKDAVMLTRGLDVGNIPVLMDYLTHELNQPEVTEKLLKMYFVIESNLLALNDY